MHKHEGLTLIGMLLTMAVVIISGVVIMRIVPVYIQNYELVSSIKALKNLPATDFSDDPASNAVVLRSRLMNQLDVNRIEDITPDQIIIQPSDENTFSVSIKYKVLKPLVYNMSLLFIFNESQEVKVRAE
jgi:hypothetical protein